MLRVEGAGGHTCSPHTLMFHCHAATRCLARDLATPSASFIILWAATCNHCCALQGGSISSKVSGSSSSMSTSPEGLHLLGSQFVLSAPSHQTMWCMGVCGVWKSSPSSSSSREAYTMSPTEWLDLVLAGTLMAWMWCLSLGTRVPHSGTSAACWVGSSRSICSNPYDLASWSGAWSCSSIFFS